MTTQHLVHSVAEALEEEFTQLPVGSRLPSDQALGNRFQLGRGTLRGIMDDFQRRGLVRRERGAGTIWLGAEVFIRPAGGVIPSFSRSIKESGREPGFEIVSVQSRRAVKSERDYLRLAPNSTVWTIQRIFTIDGERVGFATSVLPLKPLPAMPSEFEDFGSIYRTLRHRYGKSLTRCWQKKRPVVTPPAVSAALRIDRPASFQLEESLNWSADKTPIEYARSYMRNDTAARTA